MNEVVLNIALIFVFICVGGFFSASEIALVSLRESQVKALAATHGRRGERVAELHGDPNRFLASVQIGVTLAQFLSAAFGAATLTDELTPVLERHGVPEGVAGALSLVIITLVLSYVTIVLAELAAKRLALQRAEGFALLVGPFLDRIARISRPVIWLLSKSTDVVVRLLGGDPGAAREQITEEELRDLVAGHETLGGEERRLIEEVFAAGERRLSEVMVPRTEVDFLEASMPVAQAVRTVADLPHSRYPVVRGSHDDVLGFVHVRDLVRPEAAAAGSRVGDLAREVAVLPGTKQVLPSMAEMRREGHHLAIVLDEYGGTDGIVTLEDLVEELIGDIRDEYDVDEEQSQELRSGDLVVDGLLNLGDFEERAAIELPEGPYETLAGYVVHRLGRLASVGDEVQVAGRTLMVTELDGRRVARVLVAAPVPDEVPDQLPDELTDGPPDPTPTPVAG